MKLQRCAWDELDAAARSALLRRPVALREDEIQAGVTAIIDEVRRDGDKALRRLTRTYDGADLEQMRVDQQELSAAEACLNPEQLAAIDLAIANVRSFHEAQLPATIRVETMPGVVCERVSHPIDSVGLYVPAGTAPLPSAAIMLAVPAAIAACPTRILCTPPRPDGTADPAVLVAAARAGVTEIFKIGGAQAIAAMAFGTGSVPRVNKIFGPGNAWVTAAKSLVSIGPGAVAIDMPAGPSEVLVIADALASPEYVAADLLSQAEHGEDSQAVLVTTSAKLADEVDKELSGQLLTLSRVDIARKALESSMSIVVTDLESAAEVSNTYAPEHLILHTDDPRNMLPDLRNAGSIFVGPWAPESVGDYCSGTNHVLPTYGFAQTYSGLGVDQFMRYMTVQELTREGLQTLGDAVVCLAGMEGLDAHAAAVTRRLETFT